MHGLFGSLDNWQTLARKFGEDHTVFSLDVRNHGRSPHTDIMNYPAMSEDLADFMHDHHIFRASILGHSMGGKVAMHFAGAHEDLVEKLIVVDIAPVKYKGHHDEIFKALRGVELDSIGSRSEAEEEVAGKIKQNDVIQFLLKGLYRDKEAGYRWRFNLETLYRNYDHILDTISLDHPFEGPAQFIRGGKSSYVQDEGIEIIEEYFPNSEIVNIPEAGHWVHAEAPGEFFDVVKNFLAK